MKDSKVIALSGLSCAFALIFIIIGGYFPTFDISCLFMASLMVMIPLAKDTLKGAILCYISVFLLSFIFTFGHFEISIAYGIFFGLHPIVNYIQVKKIKKTWFITIVKTVWFLIVAFVIFYILKMFIVENEFVNKYLPLFILIGGSVFFLVYDYAMLRFQKNLNVIIKRLKL